MSNTPPPPPSTNRPYVQGCTCNFLCIPALPSTLCILTPMPKNSFSEVKSMKIVVWKLQPIGNSCHNNCTISDSNQLSKFNNPTLTLTQTNTPFPELQNHALHSFPSSTSSNQSNISKEKTISKPLSKITCPTRLLILHPWSQPLGSQLGEEMHCFLKP